ncbi:MAG: RNA polymerase sigma factor [Bacteroidota bacterium]
MTTQEYNNCVKLYSDAVFRFLLKNLANRADAEDVMQLTFEKLWLKREVVGFEKAKSYTFSIAHNSMIDLIRKRKFVKAYENLPERAGGEFEGQIEARDIMEQCLEILSPIQRSVILMRDYEGYSYDEIAKMTELTLSQVKVYIFRGRKKLQVEVNRLSKAS